MYVAPSARRRGVGAALVQAAFVAPSLYDESLRLLARRGLNMRMR